jgi:hypothetical protein
MPATVQIVSRASGNAVTAIGSPDDIFLFQEPIDEEAVLQRWTLQPQDSAEDCLILSVSVPGQAIGLPSDTAPGEVAALQVVPTESAQIWRVSRRIAKPPYFFLLEGNDDMLMSLASTANQPIQVAPRTEHANQQWTFLPVFAQLGNDG